MDTKMDENKTLDNLVERENYEQAFGQTKRLDKTRVHAL